MKQRARFGVAGTPPHFLESVFGSDRADMPRWLARVGLDALEVQCTYGVRMSDAQADAVARNARECGIVLSVHAPYYIATASPDPDKRQGAIEQLAATVALARRLGAGRVVFHPGGAGEDRAAALRRATETLRRFEDKVDVGQVRICPEIAGKVGALGALDEVLTLCASVSCALPCLDLAHLHAREGGSLQTPADFRRVFAAVAQRLGPSALDAPHVHLYPIAWGGSGEERHLAARRCLPRESEANPAEGPNMAAFLRTIIEDGLAPVVICEASESQDVGALAMKARYRGLLRKKRSGPAPPGP